MIEIFKQVNGKLKQVDKPSAGCWINVESPNEADVNMIKGMVDFEDDDVFTDLKDVDELARTEKYDDFVFIIFRLPYKAKLKETLSYYTFPLGIIIHEDYLITISYFDNEIIKGLKAKKINPGKKIRATLTVLYISAKTYLRYLKEIRQRTSDIQKDLETSLKNEELIQLLSLENSLVYFSTSINSNAIMIERMTKNKIFMKFADDRELLEDVALETKQAATVAKIYSDILSGTMDAFASVISNNLNIVMKFLTTTTIILMIPTLIASVYGMNVVLPFEDSPNAFVFVAVITILATLFGIFVFWKKRYF
ncbi:MAG: magnesium transporter CorA family protein [archaeon]|nr:magnesium transporter CorA family protein [archaeon]